MIPALVFWLTLVAALGFGDPNAPRTPIASTFRGGLAFVTPTISGSPRRVVLWLDTNGPGFILKSAANDLHLRISASAPGRAHAYLPPLRDAGFPPVTGDGGALPVLDIANVTANPAIFSGMDGQLGWSWFIHRIWTIDFAAHRVWLDRAAPQFDEREIVPLRLDRTRRYPRMDITVDGERFVAALDTAATIVLSSKTRATLNDGGPTVRATSFVRTATIQAWHTRHPQWPYLADAGTTPGAAMIRVPHVDAKDVDFRNVWFSSRPQDDVFEDGADYDIELGPTAYDKCAVTIDYVHDRTAFQC